MTNIRKFTSRIAGALALAIAAAAPALSECGEGFESMRVELDDQFWGWRCVRFLETEFGNGQAFIWFGEGGSRTDRDGLGYRHIGYYNPNEAIAADGWPGHPEGGGLMIQGDLLGAPRPTDNVFRSTGALVNRVMSGHLLERRREFRGLDVIRPAALVRSWRFDNAVPTLHHGLSRTEILSGNRVCGQAMYQYGVSRTASGPRMGVRCVLPISGSKFVWWGAGSWDETTVYEHVGVGADRPEPGLNVTYEAHDLCFRTRVCNSFAPGRLTITPLTDRPPTPTRTGVDLFLTRVGSFQVSGAWNEVWTLEFEAVE